MRFFKSSTLSIRLTKVLVLLTFGLFFLFSLVTFFIAYSLEDVMFNQQLLQANEQLQQQRTLPLRVKKTADLSEFGLTLSPSKQFMEFDADDLFGEFSHANKHYHYMKITDGLLLMDVTEQVVVKRGAKDIFIILLWVFLLCIIISIFIARTISAHALKPFHQLSQYFQNKGEPQSESFANVIDIEEADVKIIAHQLEQALAKQASLIEEQVMFNQSMSHEIRTPIQVMGHSMELIEANYDEIYQQPSMQRFVKSLARIKRISNALLWLTSKDTYQSENFITTVLTRVMVESKSLVTVHHLDITIDNINHYQPKAAVPEEVLELIFFNLINNTIHHGLQSNGSTALTITIDESKITFSNELESSTSEQQHFNLGLKLIKKITERFGTDFKTNVTDNQFNAMFFYLSE